MRSVIAAGYFFLVQHGVGKCHAEAFIDETLVSPHHPRVGARDVGRERLGLWQQIFGRHDFVHQPPGERGRRVDEIAAQR